ELPLIGAIQPDPRKGARVIVREHREGVRERRRRRDPVATAIDRGTDDTLLRRARTLLRHRFVPFEHRIPGGGSPTWKRKQPGEPAIGHGGLLAYGVQCGRAGQLPQRDRTMSGPDRWR